MENSRIILADASLLDREGIKSLEWKEFNLCMEYEGARGADARWMAAGK